MHRILIVEDTPAEADALVACLERYGSERGVSFRVERLSSALDFMERRPSADLIFMDIDMPGVTGMEAAELLRTYDAETPLVFVTNLAQYAVQGYEVEALDFIVKPLDWNVFSFRMTRILSRLKRRQDATAHSVVIRTDDGLRRVEIPDLRYVEVNHHTLTYHTAAGQFTQRGTMREAESALLPHGFCRCNQCYLVNLRYVTALEDEVVTVGGDQLRISRSKKKEFMSILANHIESSLV